MEGQEARDIGDSLRMEVAAPPEQEMVMRRMLDDHIHVIESNFGRFIPERAKKRAEIAAYNTIIASNIPFVKSLWKDKEKDVFGILVDTTSYDTFIGIREGLNSDGTHLTAGGVQVNLIKSPEQAWQELSEQDKAAVEAKIKQVGYDISPKEWVFDSRMFSVSGHELVHAYVDPNLPLHVNEFFAYAMENFMVAKQLGVDFSGDKLNDLYQEMVAKYGDDFYRTMFGSVRNPITRFRIFRDLSVEKVKAVLPWAKNI
jgi:hypothetical protein